MALFALTDVTEREEMIDELRYQGQHDSLTGLLNRTAFEDEMDRAEEKCGKGIGLIMCDVDGLKIVNDTLGHLAGDDLLRSTGMILRSCFREGDAIARIGGDEFAVLMTGCDSEAVETACRRLRHAVAFSTVGQTDLPLSLSVGGASTDGEARSMKALYKEADDNMYREKLTRKRSSHSGVTQALMRTLKARDHKTLDHAERLQAGVKLISERLGLSQDTMNRLQLLAQFHDIGKVGIPDRILFKPGPLTPAERAEMQRHSEIGYRIAQSSVDLQPIADLILNHHEWWNGMGYPHGLEGETIPIECRILAVMDAYDAMISDRPYRAAMSHADAVAELERCAGTQFDPNLVSKMLDVLAAWALDAAIDEANDGLKVALP
jgi:diguanylate cyclase (GGDEF)-like protein